MAYQGEFEGRIVMAGQVHFDTVKVYLSESGIDFRGGGEQGMSGPRVVLHPFHHLMLFNQAWDRAAAGYFYEISGTGIGGIKSGSGRVLDGDCTYSTVLSMRLDVKYFTDKLCVAIVGKAATGSALAGERTDTWEYCVDFAIPREQVQPFFQLGDDVRDTFFAMVDKHCKPSI